MKVKVKGGGATPGAAMEESAEAQTRVCKNCKRSVAAHNFSLHEAHCLRFLAVCPQCEEPVALKEMREHLARAHRQVRCPLCHQTMQQYQLGHHEAEQCLERPAVCSFCELVLPFCRLGAHLEACGSRTTRCWDCGKYVMYRALEDHGQCCGGSGGSPGSLSPEPKASFCQQCQHWVPQERHFQHLDNCFPLPQLLGALSTHSSPGPDSSSPPAPSPRSPPAEKGAYPKRKDKDLSSVFWRPSLKPPRSKGAPGRPAFTPTAPAPQAPQEAEDATSTAYDRLAACSQCNILLPSPVLQKHQKKCQGRAPSLQARRRSPRFLGKEEESQMQSPTGEHNWQ